MVGFYVVISVRIGYGKLEGYSLGEKLIGSEYITGVGYFVGISDGTFGSSIGSSVVNGYGNLKGYALVKKFFGSEYRTKVASSVGISDGKVGTYVGISVGNGYGKRVGSPQGE